MRSDLVGELRTAFEGAGGTRARTFEWLIAGVAEVSIQIPRIGVI